MDRRTFIKSTGAAAAIGATAGCLGAVGLGGNPDVTLSEPDRPFESEDVPYPAWGEQVADETLAAPLAGGSLALQDPGKPTLLTFFYSHCQTVCPVLIGTLRNVQAHAQSNDYADEVAFAPVTFDPARDTADRLESYGEEFMEEMGAVAGPMSVFPDVDMIEPSDISEAYMWLSSDAARYVTGITLPVDAGFLAK